MKQRARRQSDPGAMLADQVVSVIPTPKVSHDATSSSPGEVCLETLNRSFNTARKELKMLDTIVRTAETELPLVEQPTKQELIAEELRTNPSRSDREIGRICGVDHKTIAKARGKIVPTASPPVSPWKPAAEKEPPFDPFDKDGENLVVKHQPAIAIYLNPWDAVVIRQRSDDGDDPCVFVCAEHLAAVISKLSEIHAEFYHARRAAETVVVKQGRSDG
jgi:hypothetical protein